MSRSRQKWRWFGAVATALAAAALSLAVSSTERAAAQIPCPAGGGGQQPCFVQGFSTGGGPQACTVLSSPPGAVSCTVGAGGPPQNGCFVTGSSTGGGPQGFVLGSAPLGSSSGSAPQGCMVAGSCPGSASQPGIVNCSFQGGDPQGGCMLVIGSSPGGAPPGGLPQACGVSGTCSSSASQPGIVTCSPPSGLPPGCTVSDPSSGAVSVNCTGISSGDLQGGCFLTGSPPTGQPQDCPVLTPLSGNGFYCALASGGQVWTSRGGLTAGASQSCSTADPPSDPPSCQPPAGALPKPPVAPPDPMQLAQQLATALNLPLSTVQQALAAQSSQQPFNLLPPPTDPISAAATALGVTRQQLMSAVQAADQAIGVPTPTTGGTTVGIIACAGPNGSGRPDPTAFFADVAQQLGQGFTGQQVESAFVSTAPQPPDPSQVQAFQQQRLSNLAAALGVSVPALTTALSSAGIPSGCLPTLGVGGLGLSMRVQPPAGIDSGTGPIFIPLPRTGPASGLNGGSNRVFVAFHGSASAALGPGSPPQGMGMICVEAPQP